MLYRGRFAPSPTGPLHFGSLLAAVASYLEAKSKQGKWLLRIEDIDEPRCSKDAADDILQTLERFGFEWDGPVVYQSQRLQDYADALDHLKNNGLAYPCGCTRKEIADSGIQGIEGTVYPGTCRHGLPEGKQPRAWRVITHHQPITFVDAIQGMHTQHLDTDIGDFVLLRADGYYAYQLAVVVDDANQGVTHVVRGADLLDSTPRQIHLQQLLKFPAVEYAHIPVAVNQQGEKLSKQTLAQAVGISPVLELWEALDFLGQKPPKFLQKASLDEQWYWGFKHWNFLNIPNIGAVNFQP